MDNYDISTKAIISDHVSNNPLPDVAPPISVSTTFRYNLGDPSHGNNYGPGQRHVYSRESDPSTSRLELALGAVMESEAIVFGSGLTTVLALLMHLRPHKIALGPSYFGVSQVISRYEQVAGKVAIVDPKEEASLEDVDLMWIESPINPTGELLDIGEYAQRAHRAGAVVVVDSTLAPPPLSYPLRQGADYVVHSATKYLGGHSDLLAGVISTKDKKQADELRLLRHDVGLGAGSLETWLLLRSLRTLSIRVRQQSKTAGQLAQYLHSLKGTLGIVDVKHATIDQGATEGCGAVFAVWMESGEMALGVAGRLKVHQFATSLGGVESLVDWRRATNPEEDPRLLRVSVGLEDVEDLKNDWNQALA